MRTQTSNKIFTVILAVGLCAAALPRRAAAEDKGVIALQKSVELLMGQVQDLQRSFNTQIGMIQGLVTQNTDTVNKLSSALTSIQNAINGSQVVAGQQQNDLSKQFQALADTISDMQAHLKNMDTTLKQVQQMQQTIPAPASGSGAAPTGGMANPAPGTMPNTMAGAMPGPDGLPAALPNSAPLNANSPLQLYQTALSDFTNSKPAAQGELATFIRNYPNDPMVPDATYYLGTIFLQKQQYNEALDRFSQVIEQYPDSKMAPLAELNKGIALSKTGNRTAAITELRALAKNYPGTEAARQADIELKGLGASRGRGR